MRRILLLCAILLAGVCAFAEGTRTWQQSSFQDFEKGTASGIAIRSGGSLELAPAFKPVATTPSTYIWALASDAQGNVYIGAGAPARVYRITPAGQATIVFEPKELQVQSLVVDARGVIYAATSPDGMVYRIEHRAPEPSKEKKVPTPAPAAAPAPALNGAIDLKAQPIVDSDWRSSVYFEPKTKYIWDLALDNVGNLYIATGDHGEIFRVDRSGIGSLFFKSDEAHIRSLALDPQQNLIAGSDGSGLVYRISPNGQAFVLYSAPKKEITALAVDRTGNIYAAGVGEKRGGSPASSSLPVVIAAAQQTAGKQGSGTASASLPSIPAPVVGGSEIYRIAPDGSPTRLWGSRDDVVYALALDGNGHLLAGTGNKGKVFSVTSDDEFTDLLKASATQVTAFAKAPGGGLYVSTSNLGKLFLLGATPDAEGSYLSDVFDARIFSRWGRAEVRGSGAFELWARSGNVDNPDRNWSPWRQVDLTKQAPLTVPAARFIQWKAVLRPGLHPARINDVTINYLPKNVAPKVDDVTVQVGWKFPVSPRTVADNTISGPVSARPDQNAPATTRDRNSIAVRWASHDDNDDQLVYSVYYRGDGETNWKLLKDNLLDRFYSFDAGLLPDGGYTVRVLASDAPSHSPDESLNDQKESNRFEVDTTPPQVQELNAALEGDQLHITFRALDGFSDVRRAEYSVDAGEWQYVEPVGALSDYRVENYDFSIPVPGANPDALQSSATPQEAGSMQGPNRSATTNRRGREAVSDPPIESIQAGRGEHLVVVRVYDKFDNVGVAKAVIHAR